MLKYSHKLLITRSSGRFGSLADNVLRISHFRRIIKLILDSNENNHYRDHDFLFVDKGKRITPRAVDTRIRKYCEHININPKSTHKIRKSFISTLLDAGININEVRKQVGHQDERTTLHNYCFNRNDDAQKETDMEYALVN